MAEIQEYVNRSITLAAVRAKLLFDTYQWVWASPRVGVPTVREIEEMYLMLAQKAQEEGVVKCGRLVVDYADDIWTFGVELADTSNDEPIDDSVRSVGSLANSIELGRD